MLTELFAIHCPHCGESLELLFEIDVDGELIQDCEVCCRPMRLVVSRDRRGVGRLEVEPVEA